MYKIKNKLVITIILILIVILITGCEDSFISGETKFSKTGSINGILKNKIGNGILGVSVKIDNKSTTTGNDGYFSIKDLETGKHILRLSHGNYIDISKEIVVEDGSKSIGEIILKKSNNEINLNPLFEVVKLANLERYGYSTRISSKEYNVISSKLIGPNGDEWSLEKYEKDDVHKIYFSSENLKTGIFKIIGETENNFFNYDFEVKEDGFDDIPILKSPINGAIVENNNPVFEFVLTSEPDRVYLLIKKEDDNSYIWLSDIKNNINKGKVEFNDIVDNEIGLVNGEKYEWSIHLSTTNEESEYYMTYQTRSKVKTFIFDTE